MTTITTYKNFNIPIEDVSLSSIISNIKSGTYHDSINAIRMTKGMGKPERADPKCKDITRLCFVSHDPNAFLNESACTFEIAPLSEPLLNEALKEALNKLKRAK